MSFHPIKNILNGKRKCINLKRKFSITFYSRFMFAIRHTDIFSSSWTWSFRNGKFQIWLLTSSRNVHHDLWFITWMVLLWQHWCDNDDDKRGFFLFLLFMALLTSAYTILLIWTLLFVPFFRVVVVLSHTRALNVGEIFACNSTPTTHTIRDSAMRYGESWWQNLEF